MNSDNTVAKSDLPRISFEHSLQSNLDNAETRIRNGKKLSREISLYQSKDQTDSSDFTDHSSALFSMEKKSIRIRGKSCIVATGTFLVPKEPISSFDNAVKAFVISSISKNGFRRKGISRTLNLNEPALKDESQQTNYLSKKFEPRLADSKLINFKNIKLGLWDFSFKKMECQKIPKDPLLHHSLIL